MKTWKTNQETPVVATVPDQHQSAKSRPVFHLDLRGKQAHQSHRTSQVQERRAQMNDSAQVKLLYGRSRQMSRSGELGGPVGPDPRQEAEEKQGEVREGEATRPRKRRRTKKEEGPGKPEGRRRKTKKAEESSQWKADAEARIAAERERIAAARAMIAAEGDRSEEDAWANAAEEAPDEEDEVRPEQDEAPKDPDKQARRADKQARRADRQARRADRQARRAAKEARRAAELEEKARIAAEEKRLALLAIKRSHLIEQEQNALIYKKQGEEIAKKPVTNPVGYLPQSDIESDSDSESTYVSPLSSSETEEEVRLERRKELIDTWLNSDELAQIELRVDHDLGIKSRPDVQARFSGEGLRPEVRGLQLALRGNSRYRVDMENDNEVERSALTDSEKASTGWALLPMKGDYFERDRGKMNDHNFHFATQYLFSAGEDLKARADQKLGTAQKDTRESKVIHYKGGKWCDSEAEPLDSSGAGELAQARTERTSKLKDKVSGLQEERTLAASDPERLAELESRLIHLASKSLPEAIRAHHSVRGRFIFVMDAAGKFLAAPAEAWVIHHSSFLAGGAVAAAGEVGFKDGKLTSISNTSGHYRPGPAYLWQAVKQLEQLGVPLHDVAVTVMGVGSRFRSAEAFLAAMDPEKDPRWFDSTFAIKALKGVLAIWKAGRPAKVRAPSGPVVHGEA